MDSLASLRLQAPEKTVALRCENLGGWSECCSAAVAKKQNFGERCERVGGIVRGHDGLNFVFAQPILQADEKRIGGDAVERGEWFIKEKQTWSGRKSARQCHALRLSAREILWAAGGEIGCANEIEHFVYAARRARCDRGSEGRKPHSRRR